MSSPALRVRQSERVLDLVQQRRDRDDRCAQIRRDQQEPDRDENAPDRRGRANLGYLHAAGLRALREDTARQTKQQIAERREDHQHDGQIAHAAKCRDVVAADGEPPRARATG